jgi:CRISPR/Cas system type I-B associated protein Csh2 (Cas7 group RAMP superfamily)
MVGIKRNGRIVLKSLVEEWKKENIKRKVFRKMSGLERLKLWCRTESANEDDFKELEKEIKKQGAVEELRFIHNKFCFKHKDIREYVEKRLKELKEGV